MNTPIYDYLIKYASSGITRMHMPGHKGICMENELSKIFPLDITEITDAGNLFETEGIIAQSEKNASRIFGTAATFYSVHGSTQCIQTMLALMKYENRNVIAVRNAHRAFLSACVLLDIDPQWICPHYDDTIISGTISESEVEEKLKKTKNACLYVTSPDYLGCIADIETLARICHKYGAVLLVDNAHGACLPFYRQNLHPISLGADMCCDSAHKMLPALTGAAYLHLREKKYIPYIKDSMLLFASTSPSYLISCSLDLCNLFLEKEIREKLVFAQDAVSGLRDRVSGKFSVQKGTFAQEPLHFTINAHSSGIDGSMLMKKLQENKIECEFYCDTHLVMLFSPSDTEEAYQKVGDALMNIDFEKKTFSEKKLHFPLPQKHMSVREAALSPYEELPIEKSEGKICANINVPFPPAIPISVSGEIITAECIDIMRRFGLTTIKVVK
ncbi:MAG: aminotransferase class V-fold PLP-dependent enzyme [Oscillospiraceae bacterium]|nr:aminotransferase class V-fold PLP-dependent enzyme [Oscillospiraceae bacterium]